MSHVILNEGKIAVEYVGSNPITRATRVKLPVAKRVCLSLMFSKSGVGALYLNKSVECSFN